MPAGAKRLGVTFMTSLLVGSTALTGPALAAERGLASSAGVAYEAGVAGAADASAIASAADAIEFVYIENSLVATGATQNVAVGFKALGPTGGDAEGEGAVRSGRLTVANADTGEKVVVESVVSTGSALRFSFVPVADGTYEIESVEVTRGEGDSATSETVSLEGTDASVRRFVASASAVPVAREDGAVDVIDPGEYAVAGAAGAAAGTADATAGAGAGGPLAVAVYSADTSGNVTELATSGSSGIADGADDADGAEAVVEQGVATALADEGAASDDGALSALSVQSDLATQADVNGDGIFTIALDPGHGGYDSGAVGVGGAREADLAWEIACYCEEELEAYAGVEVVFTKDWGSDVSIRQRVENAVAAGADVVVSIHLNATSGGSAGGGSGCMVLVPGNQAYNNHLYGEGAALGNAVNAELSALGIQNKGLLYRYIDDEPEYNYPTGEHADYYGIVRYARTRNILGVIIEHAYIDNVGDYYGFLDSDDKLRALGVADARGIAKAYGLVRDASRAYSAVYNYDLYLRYNPDLAGQYGNDPAGALNHFLQYGMAEGRRASDDFDPIFYKNAYADLATAYGDNLPKYYAHYIKYGQREGRQPTAELDSSKDGMRRLYNPYSGEHFYTASAVEKNSLVQLGWNYEGLGWVGPRSSGTPVYRLYNPYAGDHHYTTSAFERDSLRSVGWNDEGTGWYSDDAQGVPLFRQYNPYAQVGTHNYTTSKAENDHLVSVGWREEGIGWYGLS